MTGWIDVAIEGGESIPQPLNRIRSAAGLGLAFQFDTSALGKACRGRRRKVESSRCDCPGQRDRTEEVNGRDCGTGGARTRIPQPVLTRRMVGRSVVHQCYSLPVTQEVGGSSPISVASRFSGQIY